jgi:hypothetical protein
LLLTCLLLLMTCLLLLMTGKCVKVGDSVWPDCRKLA